jgi:hypothetical protein
MLICRSKNGIGNHAGQHIPAGIMSSQEIRSAAKVVEKCLFGCGSVMQMIPHSKEQWFDLVLFPAKVWLIVFAVVINLRLPLGDSRLSEIGLACFLFSAPFLLLGALFQALFCQSGSASRTLVFLTIIAAIFYASSRWQCGGFLIVIPGWLTWRLIRACRERKPLSEEPIQCIECQTIIPVGESGCSHCGWTFTK